MELTNAEKSYVLKREAKKVECAKEIAKETIIMIDKNSSDLRLISQESVDMATTIILELCFEFEITKEMLEAANER